MISSSKVSHDWNKISFLEYQKWYDFVKSELVNMTRAWDNDKIWENLRFFLCPRFVSCWSAHFSNFITELKIHHLYSVMIRFCSLNCTVYIPLIFRETPRNSFEDFHLFTFDIMLFPWCTYLDLGKVFIAKLAF